MICDGITHGLVDLVISNGLKHFDDQGSNRNFIQSCVVFFYLLLNSCSFPCSFGDKNPGDVWVRSIKNKIYLGPSQQALSYDKSHGTACLKVLVNQHFVADQ